MKIFDNSMVVKRAVKCVGLCLLVFVYFINMNFYYLYDIIFPVVFMILIVRYYRLND